MNSNQAYTKMLTNPDHFFKHYPINPAGPAGNYVPGQANLKTVKLYKKDPEVTIKPVNGQAVTIKAGHYGATRPGLLGHQREISSWVLNQGAAPNATFDSKNVNAIGVPMILYNDVNFNSAAMDTYICDGSGDGIMVTGQLSGCTFCIMPTAGGVACIHVKPEGIGAIQLHNELHTQGRFNGHNTALTTWGRNDYPNFSNVFGIRRGGQWSFYAQLSADAFLTIRAAYKIYPGAKRML